MAAYVTRFAPSPTGYLHLGHAYSALTGYHMARDHDGRFLLRIEDTDLTRCRPAFEQAIYDDLAWLGLEWEDPVRRQSEHFDDYTSALRQLGDRGLTYPCFCTRTDILEGVNADGNLTIGPEGPLYPGTCRALPAAERTARIKEGAAYAVRLDTNKAIRLLAAPLCWHEVGHGTIAANPALLGDPILAGKDTPASYHLAVVVDDALQNITHVIRGQDLFFATHLHRLLQHLLGLAEPVYHHHRLVLDESGKKLSKRRGSTTLHALREAGAKPDQILAMAEAGLAPLGESDLPA